MGVFAAVLLIIGFSIRQSLLNAGFQKAQDKLAAKGLLLKAKNLEFNGLASIEMLGFEISTPQQFKIIECDSLNVELSPLSGILGMGWIDEISIATLNLQWIDSIQLESNTNARETNVETENSTSSPIKLIKDLLQQLPSKLAVNKMALRYWKGPNVQLFQAEQINWERELLNATIAINQNKEQQLFTLKGKLDRRTLEGNLTLEGINQKLLVLEALGGQFGFSKMDFSIDEVNTTASGIHLKSSCNIARAYANHRRISDTSVYIDALMGSPELYFENGNIRFDSSSIWRINTFEFQAGAQYPFRDTLGEYWAFLKFDKTAGNHLFPSLPAGLFRYTAGTEIKGSFEHRFYVWYTPRDLSKTILEADVDYSKDFKVIQWGKANPMKINGSFHHDYFDGDRWEVGFEVGPNNPFYTPFNQISPNLVESTLRSEDPSFYGHNGFYLEAFREALIANLREKRFARGGSTISMQLIKNVYMRQHKTLARKLEEIMLVWLIEKERAVSKQRMLEVYFNIIEWGPGIFGVGSASQFYFGKHPSQLNMGESCYLSSLIPAPSKARWSVDSTGSVNPRWSRYYKLKNRIIRLDSTRFNDEDFAIKIRGFNNPQ